MKNEIIKVRITQSGQLIDALIYSKRASQIEVVIGEGQHSVKCALTPTTNGRAYAGSVMGREIVYERGPEQVQADIDATKPSTRRR
jgi:hypothetical protein